MARHVLRTRICDQFGIEYPIFLAGMGDVCKDESIADANLVAAVSNAGGMGIMGGGTLSPENLRTQIRRVRELTDKPFGVDLVFTPGGMSLDGTIDEIRSQLPEKQLQYIEDLYTKFDVPPQKGPEIKVLDESHTREQWDVCADEEIEVIAMGLGTPAWLVPQAHDLGMSVISLAGSTKHAVVAAALGVDMIVAQGTEAGGHTGRIGLMSLLPQVVTAVAPIPVLAAGGIVNGQQLAAALALGAEGVWVGTAFQASQESPLPDELKQKFVEATESAPRITKVPTGKTIRALPNRVQAEWDGSGVDTLPAPFQNYLVRDFLYSSWEHDYEELGYVGAGQGTAMITEIKSASEIVDHFGNGAVERLGTGLPADVQVR